MIIKTPSDSARVVAQLRAAHQILEGGSVFKDRFASVILGEDPNIIAERVASQPWLRPVRLFMA
ncbi:MAG TPA: hypothetical protein VGD54_02110, partial [Steroidobacteraceae bacterium]